MENKNKPAFPVPDQLRLAADEMGNYEIPLDGLTKREAFAKAAMQGFCSNAQFGETAEEIATASIKVADELLKQLES